MAPWILPLAQSVLASRQNAQDEAQARRMAQADIYRQRAQSLGFPAYGIQAADTNRRLQDQYGSRNYLAALLPMLMGGGGSGQ